jgi:hypothetical protein
MDLNCNQKYCIDESSTGLTVSINPAFGPGAAETGLGNKQLF